MLRYVNHQNRVRIRYDVAADVVGHYQSRRAARQASRRHKRQTAAATEQHQQCEEADRAGDRASRARCVLRYDQVTNSSIRCRRIAERSRLRHIPPHAQLRHAAAQRRRRRLVAAARSVVGRHRTIVVVVVVERDTAVAAKAVDRRRSCVTAVGRSNAQQQRVDTATTTATTVARRAVIVVTKAAHAAASERRERERQQRGRQRRRWWWRLELEARVEDRQEEPVARLSRQRERATATRQHLPTVINVVAVVERQHDHRRAKQQCQYVVLGDPDVAALDRRQPRQSRSAPAAIECSFVVWRTVFFDVVNVAEYFDFCHGDNIEVFVEACRISFFREM